MVPVLLVVFQHTLVVKKKKMKNPNESQTDILQLALIKTDGSPPLGLEGPFLSNIFTYV